MSPIPLLVPLRNLSPALHLPLSCFYTRLLFVGVAAAFVGVAAATTIAPVWWSAMKSGISLFSRAAFSHLV